MEHESSNSILSHSQYIESPLNPQRETKVYLSCKEFFQLATILGLVMSTCVSEKLDEEEVLNYQGEVNNSPFLNSTHPLY